MTELEEVIYADHMKAVFPVADVVLLHMGHRKKVFLLYDAVAVAVSESP